MSEISMENNRGPRTDPCGTPDVTHSLVEISPCIQTAYFLCVWNLWQVGCMATKLVDGFAKLEYQERLRRLDLPTLEFRRRRGDMIETYKHFNAYDRATIPSTFRPRTRVSRMHDFQLHLPKSNDGERGVQTNPFYHRVAPIWNNLPSDVVGAKSVNGFKNALDDFWKDDPSKFNHKYAPPNEDT